MKIDLKEEKLSLTEALKKAKFGDIIMLDGKVYNEKITIDTPNITLCGRKGSKIVYHATSEDIIPAILGGDGKKTYGTTGSATVLVTQNANAFQAFGITFENNFRRDGRIQAQAVAFKAEASHIYLKECSFISHQDTLYLDYGTDNVIEDCLIEGDVDFIFGSADCMFKNCRVHALGDEKKQAYYTAPDTYLNHTQGFIFEDCKFSFDEKMEVYLGRPWYPSKALEKVQPRVSFIHCEFSKEIHLYLKQMHEKDSSNYILHLENNQLL